MPRASNYSSPQRRRLPAEQQHRGPANSICNATSTQLIDRYYLYRQDMIVRRLIAPRRGNGMGLHTMEMLSQVLLKWNQRWWTLREVDATCRREFCLLEEWIGFFEVNQFIILLLPRSGRNWSLIYLQTHSEYLLQLISGVRNLLHPWHTFWSVSSDALSSNDYFSSFILNIVSYSSDFCFHYCIALTLPMSTANSDIKINFPQLSYPWFT